MPASSDRCTASASRASSRCSRRPGFAAARSDRARDVNGAKVLGMADRIGKRARGLRRRSAGRQRQPAREPAACMNPYGTDVMTYNGQVVNNYVRLVKPGDPNVQDGPWRRHRVDDQGRHPVSRADADEGSQGHGGKGPRRARPIHLAAVVRPVTTPRTASAVRGDRDLNGLADTSLERRSTSPVDSARFGRLRARASRIAGSPDCASTKPSRRRSHR